MKPVLTVKGLTVGYGNRTVLKDVDLKLTPGEIVSIVGPNGAGKTTLLKTMARQLEPMGGTVYLKENDLQTIKPLDLAKEMAVVFSDALRPDRMTCREAVAAGRYPYTGRFGTLSEEDHKVVLRAMEQVHVADLQERPFTEISDGQRQRVVLARALCQEPDIILLDEPTTFLDIRWKAEFLTVLKTLAKEEGLSVLLTMHELELAAKVSDRLVCVKEGRVDRIGPPEEVFTETYLPALFDLPVEDFRQWF